MNELLWDLLRATEAAALAAHGQAGRGDKLLADRDATRALRDALNRIDFAGQIVIGEGEKDQAPGLFAGERVGRKAGPAAFDIAVDPIDGTTQTSRGGTDALSVLAVGSAGSLFSTRAYYLRKLAAGPRVVARLGRPLEDLLPEPVGRLVPEVARAAGKDPSELTVCLLDRPRHAELVAELRRAGCRIHFLDCDVSGALATAVPGSGIDLNLGVGGAPEAVLSAAALKCLGGSFCAAPVDGDGPVLARDDLVRGEVCFVATGVTDGTVLRGVRPAAGGLTTHSLVLCTGDRAARWVQTEYAAE